MGCTTSRSQSDLERIAKKDRFSFEVIPPSEIDIKNDKLAIQI